jgi:folylpolyglutamate synthase
VRGFLGAHGRRTGFPGKIGLYTSPDLRHVRERIQIDNEPITEGLFAQYFWEVWERLGPDAEGNINMSAGEGEGRKGLPRYLQFLALVAFHTFIREEVHAAIFETHHGGEFDATNVISDPVATGITSIGMDHLAQLGPTLENIAWHKSGIFKAGAKALSAPQDRPELVRVLRTRAAEKGVDLAFVNQVNSALLVPTVNEMPAMRVPVQRVNCSLALAIADAFLERKGLPGLTDEDIARGVEDFTWPGRFEIIPEGKSQWFVDGAHNELSLVQVAEWFAQSTIGTSTPRIVIFSHFSENREGKDLADRLALSLKENGVRPEHVIFTTYQERAGGSARFGKSDMHTFLCQRNSY